MTKAAFKSTLAAAALTVCALAADPSAHAAGQDEELRDKISDFSMELTQCHAYYGIVAHCMDISGQPGAADVAKQTERTAESLGPLEFETGTMAGLNQAALLGRLQMMLDSMKRDMGQSCINIAAVYAKYAMSCKSLVEHPETHLNTNRDCETKSADKKPAGKKRTDRSAQGVQAVQPSDTSRCTFNRIDDDSRQQR